MTHAIPEHPWQQVAMDICTVNQQNYLVLVDDYSDFIEIEVVADTSAETVGMSVSSSSPDTIYLCEYLRTVEVKLTAERSENLLRSGVSN